MTCIGALGPHACAGLILNFKYLFNVLRTSWRHDRLCNGPLVLGHATGVECLFSSSLPWIFDVVKQ